MEELELDPKPKPGPAVLVVPLVALVCLLLYWGGIFDGADRAIYDLMYSVRGPVAPSEQIVLVGIDQKSLAKIGRWPWDRGRYGGLIRAIDGAGARSIGLLVQFQDDANQEA